MGPDEMAARATTLEGDARAAAWERMATIWPAYDDYQAKTDRVIPVVRLEPLLSPPGPAPSSVL